MRVAVRDPAGRELDAVAAHQPPGGRVELHVDREERAFAAVFGELPDQRPAVDLPIAEPRLVPLDVVDHPVTRCGRHAVSLVVEREPQWKYWPPSMTII